jgi:hypothetical protein
MTLVRRSLRPSQVQQLINELAATAEDIELRRGQIEHIAVAMKALGADTSELVDAAHDLLHGWKHLTSTRRALVMAWPEGEDQ